MPHATRSPVAKTGLTIPSICFGTSALGDMPDTYGYSVDEARARATLDAIFDGPIGFLDTSRNYGAGRSEARIGAAIKARGGLPKGFVISSKLDRNMENNFFDGDRAERSLEESLKALNVTSIPLLHLHDPVSGRHAVWDGLVVRQARLPAPEYARQLQAQSPTGGTKRIATDPPLRAPRDRRCPPLG